MRVLISGAAGNLGSLLARHLLENTAHTLNLMVHRRPVAHDLSARKRVKIFNCDLASPDTLRDACRQSDVVVHFAGKLFAPNPAKFLPVTNFQYGKNLMDVAVKAGVKKFILVSFPQVEGPTSPENPCGGRLNGSPVSVHAQTRLQEEQYLFQVTKRSRMKPLVLRSGMIYGREVLMCAFARKLSGKDLLCVWKAPTPIHVLSLEDFNECCRAAIENGSAQGVYPLGDEAPLTLQEFMDKCCDQWKTPRAWRLPYWVIYAGAIGCELMASALATKSFLTGDFVKLGRVPYCCDTKRMRRELVKTLKYRTVDEGISTV